LRDPDDDFILELASAAGADYFVTHNRRDFAGVEAFRIEVITPAEMVLKLDDAT
jgi:predicted nucleic acid-binding protein